MTIAMLSLAGFPATAGFFGKIYLIEAAVDNQYAFLGVVIVLGSAISLAYYLRVVAAVWMSAPDEARGSSRVVAPGTARPAIAGGSQEADGVLEQRLRPAPRLGCAITASSRWSARSRRSRSASTPSRSSTSPTTRRGVARTCCRPGASFLRARLSSAPCCASPTPYRRPGLRRVRRTPRSGVRRRGGGRGGGVGAADRGAGRAAGQARDLPGRGWDLHTGGGARGRARRRAWCRCGRTGSGSAGGCWW